MACDFELPEPVSLDPFLKDLNETGYLTDFVGGYLVFYGWPYLDNNVELQHGDLAFPVDLTNDAVAAKNHQAWWRGSRPCDQTGRNLRLGGGIDSITVAGSFVADQSFSFKLNDENGHMRDYASLEEKVRTYLDAITAPALAAFPDATPLAAIAARAAAQDSPLKVPDTMSARYHLNDLSALLRGKKVAIIGLGGTGSYILDYIARTHLERITLFDDDKVHIHTIFRWPGFIPGAIDKLKVNALGGHYSQWHGAIEPVSERVTPENISRLKDYDFVFVSVDNGPSRHVIVDWLSWNNVPFVDCGMGLNRSTVGLSGFIRITGTDRRAFDENVGTVRLPIERGKDDEYGRHAQITELNALNAALAVIRFKQHFRLLDRESEATSHILDTATLEID